MGTMSREGDEGYANERKVLKIVNELQLIIHSTLSTTMMSRNDYELIFQLKSF